MTYRPDPSLDETATLFVTTDGDDSNDGLSWRRAFATIDAAVAALPANGGIIEVGYGEFAGFTIEPADTASTPNFIHIRGRGTGHDQSATSADTSVASPGRHATRLTTPCTVVGTFPGGLSGDAAGNWIPFVLENIAITGVTGDGLTLKTPNALLRHVSCSSNSGRGIVVGPSYSWFLKVEHCRCVRNGSNGFYGSGLQTASFVGCQFDANEDAGFVTADNNSEDLSFWNCWFQRNGGAGFDGYMLTGLFLGCHWDGNVNSGGAQALIANGSRATFLNCFFATGNSCNYAIDTPTAAIVAINNVFGPGHVVSSLRGRPNNSGQTPPGFSGLFSANRCNDPAFVTGASYPTIPAAAAGGTHFGVGAIGQVPVTVAVSADGAITLDASKSSDYIVNLAANVTGTTISNPSPGQRLAITFAQDATGGRTYVWPTAKFAGASAPSDTTAGTQTRVDLRYDGTSWWEVSRSVAVG